MNDVFKAYKKLIKKVSKVFNKTTTDRTKFSKRQIEIMCKMWASWEKDPSLYKTQDDFAEDVNFKLDTNKSRTTIIRHIKKRLNEII